MTKLPRALLCLWIAGCGGDPAARTDPPPTPAAVARPPLDLPAEGATIRVGQRNDAAVPGSAEALRIALGDISGGKVQMTVARRDGSGVLVSRSVGQGDVVPLLVEGHAYTIAVETLANLLVGDDYAELRIRPESPPAGAAPSPVVDERARIEGLLATIASSGIVFIRNGSDHSAAEAADHLRSKWSRAGDRIATAEDFIEQLASRSSQSGEAYRVRLPDGTVHDAGPWLREQLAKP